jgi:hypothetical protein
MQIDAALVREQGVNFVVVAVKRPVLDQSASKKGQIAGQFSTAFGSVPVVLMTQDFKGVPIYWGRQDLVRWLSNVPFELLPWGTYSVN